MEIAKGLWRNTRVPIEHQPAIRPNLLTVTFPGFLSSRAMVAKYTGNDPVIILDHARNHPEGTVLPELFRTTCNNAPRLVHNVLPLSDLDELDYNSVPWYSPLSWFNGLRTRIQKSATGADCLPVSTNIPRLNNLGGYIDQAAALEVIKKGIAAQNASTDSKSLILFGFSRGATTFLQASLKLDKELASHIAMVVLEAPFDTLDNIIQDSSLFPSLSRAALNRMGNPSLAEAYQMPDSTNLTCPLIFITSEVDSRVPKKSTMRAIEEVRSRYPQIPVEHLELQNSMHPSMSIQDVDDRNRYVTFMEAMYNKYTPQ